MTPKLELVLWAAGFLGNGLLFSVLLRKKHWQRFPVFTMLAGYECVRSIILFVISHSGFHSAYVNAYWTSEGVDILLQLGLLFELGRTLVHSAPSMKRSFLLLLLPKYWLGFAVLLAVLCATAIPAAKTIEATLDMRASLFTSLLTCELYLLIITKANRVRLDKNRDAMAISNGIATWSVCALTSDLIHQMSGWERGALRFDEFRSFVVLFVLAYWTAFFFWRSSTHAQAAIKSAKDSFMDAHAFAGKVGS